MLKKVLLVTLQGANIGNRLQNYALQSVLERLGVQVTTPYYDIPELDTVEKKIKNTIKAILGFFGSEKYRRKYYAFKRRIVFKRFDNAYISNMVKCKFDDDIKEKTKCDYAITGSDQVWHNWSNDTRELEYFYLKSFPADRRISYAPSFGFDSFHEIDISVHKAYLLEMKYLTCREKKASEMILDLTGREAKIMLDPCLLLDKEEWNKIAKKPKHIENEKYALVYILGEKNKDYMDSIRTFCEKENLEIIDVFNNENPEWLFTAPDEFVWLLKNCQYVFTDSFHATLFSILYGKKFLSFKRIEPEMEGMFDRIETLLNLFAIENHVYDGNVKLVENDYQIKNIDGYKEQAISYLKEALGLV